MRNDSRWLGFARMNQLWTIAIVSFDGPTSYAGPSQNLPKLLGWQTF